VRNSLTLLRVFYDSSLLENSALHAVKNPPMRLITSVLAATTAVSHEAKRSMPLRRSAHKVLELAAGGYKIALTGESREIPDLSSSIQIM
jgi:hypothetical protein